MERQWMWYNYPSLPHVPGGPTEIFSNIRQLCWVLNLLESFNSVCDSQNLSEVEACQNPEPFAAMTSNAKQNDTCCWLNFIYSTIVKITWLDNNPVKKENKKSGFVSKPSQA